MRERLARVPQRQVETSGKLLARQYAELAVAIAQAPTD